MSLAAQQHHAVEVVDDGLLQQFGLHRLQSAAAQTPEAKQELEEVVEFLKYPERVVALCARIPRGVLLVGPPGTGKTRPAEAFAGELAGAPRRLAGPGPRPGWLGEAGEGVRPEVQRAEPGGVLPDGGEGRGNG